MLNPMPYPLTGLADVDSFLDVRDVITPDASGIVTMYGPAKGGKTALALHMAKQKINQGKRVLYIDLYNGTGLTDLPEGLTLLQPDKTDALDALVGYVKSGDFAIVVLDGLEQTQPKLAEGEEPPLAWRARTLAVLLPLLQQKCEDLKVLLVLITGTQDSQVFRNEIGVTPLFYSWLRLRLEPAGVTAAVSRITIDKHLRGPTQGFVNEFSLSRAWG